MTSAPALAISDSTNTKIKITWDTVTSISLGGLTLTPSYIVEWDTGTTGAWTIAGTTLDTFFTF